MHEVCVFYLGTAVRRAVVPATYDWCDNSITWSLMDAMQRLGLAPGGTGPIPLWFLPQ
jgi:hypothetical protein